MKNARKICVLDKWHKRSDYVVPVCFIESKLILIEQVKNGEFK